MIIKFETSYEVSCRFLIRNYVELVKNSIMRSVDHGRGMATTNLNMPLPFFFVSGTSGSNVLNIINPPFDKAREHTLVPIRNLVNNRIFNQVYGQISLELNNGQQVVETIFPPIIIGSLGTPRWL